MFAQTSDHMSELTDPPEPKRASKSRSLALLDAISHGSWAFRSSFRPDVQCNRLTGESVPTVLKRAQNLYNLFTLRGYPTPGFPEPSRASEV
jgi:hypothetical protein